MQAFVKSTPCIEFRPIPFINRLIMLPASLPFLGHPTALTPSLGSWPEPKPPTGRDSIGTVRASGTLATHRINSASLVGLKPDVSQHCTVSRGWRTRPTSVQAPAQNLPLPVTLAGSALLASVAQRRLVEAKGSGISQVIAALELLGMTTVIEVFLPRRLGNAPVLGRPVPVADRPRRLVARTPAIDSLSNWSNTKKKTGRGRVLKGKIHHCGCSAGDGVQTGQPQ